jgi:fatty-acyl-CoA synthase
MSDNPIYIEELLKALQRAERSIVLRHREHDFTGAMLRDLIYRYARSLRSFDIGRGSLLGLLAPNTPDAIAIRYAAHILGAATVFLSNPPTKAARETLIRQIRPQLLVLFSETAGLFNHACEVPFATVGVDKPGALARLDVAAAAVAPDPLPIEAVADELAVVSSSGGSTGIPKGSCRSFRSYSAMVTAPAGNGRIQLVNGKLAYLSQVLVDITLLGDGRVILQDAYEAGATLAAIEAERVTDLFLVEPQLFELMDHVNAGKHDLSSLRSLVHIGASAPKSLRLRASRRLGPVISHAYGASEMGLVSVLAPAEYRLCDQNLFTSAGHIQPNVDVRFRRTDGRLAEPGEIGMIEVRSPAMADGYRNNPALTALSFSNGWYKTGDLGRMDERGLMHIAGRAADAQTADGRLVMPTDIEDALCNLPSIKYAVVIRDAEARLTVAAAIAWPGIPIDAAACRQEISRRFGSGISVQLVLVQVDRMPLNEQGKPDRSAIRQLVRTPLAA